MRLVIVCELSSWRVVTCCWLTDHALAVTCTDGLGLGLGLIRLEEMRWRRCGTCCSGGVCVRKLSFFLFSILYSKEGTNKTPTALLLSASLSQVVSIPSRVTLIRSPQFTTQPTTVLILQGSLPLHILVGDLRLEPNCSSTPRKEKTRPITACS
jgi:hypothetical protein